MRIKDMVLYTVLAVTVGGIYLSNQSQPPKQNAVSHTVTASTDGQQKPTNGTKSGAQPPLPKRTEITESGTQNIVKLIAAADWAAANKLIDANRLDNIDVSTAIPTLEVAALKVVKPLPGSDFAGNEAGYRFLLHLVPDNPEYQAKVDDYAGKIAAAEDRNRKAALNKMRKSYDKVESVTWYKHTSQPKYLNSRSTVYLYIGQRDGGRPWLRLVVQYAASDWLFVGRVDAWYDGFKVPIHEGGFQRDNHSTIWEWVDLSANEYHVNILRSMADSKEVILRYSGQQYHRDVTLSSRDKKAIRDVLTAFEALNQ